jgi:hypothetical protein
MSGRLIDDDFRIEYGKSFYQWPECDDKMLLDHKDEYTRQLKQLYEKSTLSEEETYRANVLVEMLKDLT